MGQVIFPYLTKVNLTSTPLLMTKAAVWTKAQSLVLFWDGTGQTYEQTDFFSENILMEKSFWIYTKLIIERLILGIKNKKDNQIIFKL